MEGGRSASRRCAVGVISVLIALTACTGDSDAGPATTSTVPVPPVTEPPREADGRLRIGVLLPTDAPLVADAIGTAAQSAADDINAAGGVLGRLVELVALEEGSSPGDVTAAITQLVDDGVDAIVGPITSTNAVTAVDAASAAGIVSCSPSATAAILDDAPDDLLFFRTIASDSMQAAAIAEAAENTGARTVAIAHVDDAFGRPYATATELALDDRALDAMTTIGFAPDDDVDEVARSLASLDADVLIALAAGPDLARLLTALDQVAAPFDTIITNDSLRTAANQPIIAELSGDLRGRLLGVAPQIVDRRDSADAVVFGPQVADCVNLIALATVQAGADTPRLIAGQMAAVSSGGRLCRTFDACATQIDLDRQIDYNGATGLTELDRDGHTSRAWFERFTFDLDGTDVYDDSARLQISS